MKFCKKTFIIIIMSSILSSCVIYPVNIHADTFHSKYAAMIDADTRRLLYGKNENTPAAMASTTKIMTLITSLEHSSPDLIVTTSSYAASMPDVQLDAVTGEQFFMKDMYYSLMLESHNDSAVIIAENTAFFYLCEHAELRNDISFIPDYNYDSSFISELSEENSRTLVNIFIDLMNNNADKFKLNDTLFITPNGLDAESGNNFHHTTAYDLAVLMSECIKSADFLDITQCKSYVFTDTAMKHSYSLNNKNLILNPGNGLISGKTGFTSSAGYCYVCAYTDNERTLCIALLGCGWPPSRNYKWSDVRYLLALGSKYKKTHLLSDKISFYIPINNDNESFCRLDVPSYDISILTGENDDISYDIIIPESLDKMPDIDFIYGYISIYINNEFVLSISLDNLADNY